MTSPFSRRQFLQTSAAGVATVAAAGCASSWLVKDPASLPAAPPVDPATPSDLVHVKGTEVEDNLDPALSKLLGPLGGMAAFVKAGQTVLLKPNLAFDKPLSFRASTSPHLIAAVAKLALEQGAGRVIVADHSVSNAEKVIQIIGLRDALEGLDVEVMLVDGDSPWVERSIPNGVSLTSAAFLDTALSADVHIAMPIAKSHGMAGFTGTLKGMMGLVRDRMGFHMLHDLHEAIVDLNTVLKPHLIIMEGLEIMTTDGPFGPGKLVRADSLIAGTDPVAVDSAGVRLAPLYEENVDPARIRHIALAAARGIGYVNLPEDRVHQIAM